MDIVYNIDGLIQWNTSFVVSEYYYMNNFTHSYHDGLSPSFYEYVSCVDAKLDVFQLNDGFDVGLSSIRKFWQDQD